MTDPFRRLHPRGVAAVATAALSSLLLAGCVGGAATGPTDAGSGGSGSWPHFPARGR